MIKIFHDLSAFWDINVEKYAMMLFSFVCTLFSLFIGPIIANQYFVVIMSLLFLDFILGTTSALLNGVFSFRKALCKPLKKIAEYGLYTAVALLLAKAPMTLVITPIVVFMFTYMIVKEASSVMRLSSEVFNNKDIGRLSANLGDFTDKWLNKTDD